MTTRVAVYARYSSKNQNDVSIEDQFTMTDAYAAKQGWTITGRFSDRARTGKNSHRPGLKQMFEELRTGAFDVVLVLSVDRLSRNLGDTLQFHDLFLFQRVELHTVLPEGKQDFLRLLVLGLAAQMTSSSTGEHTQKRIVNMLEKEGRITALPYGYRKLASETGVNREPDPITAPIVCRIFDEFASGMSAEAIIDRLNAEGIPSPQGSDWSRSTLRGNRTRNDGLLRNSTYAGRLVYNATSTVFEPGTGRRKVFETPEKRVEVFVPALQIVPDETYAAVQARLEATSQKVRSAGNASAAHRPRYLMKDLLVCAHCGRPYTIQAAGKYYCRNKAQCGNRTSIARDRIEARVFAALRGFLLSPELEARFDTVLASERRRLEGNDGKAELRELRRRRTEAQTGLKGIMRAVEQGAPYATFHDRAEQLSKEIESLDSQIEAIGRARATPRPSSSRALYAEVLERMEHLLSDPEVLLEAHEHLTTIIREVRLRPDPTAPDGMAAEILMDLGSLLSGAGYHRDFADRLARDPQMTVGLWGSAPRRVARACGRKTLPVRQHPPSRADDELAHIPEPRRVLLGQHLERPLRQDDRTLHPGAAAVGGAVERVEGEDLALDRAEPAGFLAFDPLAHQILHRPGQRPVLARRRMRLLQYGLERPGLAGEGGAVHRSEMEASQPLRVQVVEIAVEAAGDGHELQPGHGLGDQMRLGLRPAVFVLRQRGAAAVFEVHEVDRRDVDTAVVDRPVDEVAPAGLAAVAVVAEPDHVGVHLRPEQRAARQLLVIEPLAHRVLQLRRHGELADDLLDHLALELLGRGQGLEVPSRLGGVGGHLHQFPMHREARFLAVEGELARPGAVDPAGHVVLVRHGPERVAERNHVARQQLDLLAAQRAFRLELRRHPGEMPGDRLEFLEIAPGDPGVFQLDMVAGEGVGFRHDRP